MSQSVWDFLKKHFSAHSNLKVLWQNKTVAFCISVVIGGAAYSIYKKLTHQQEDKISTITKVQKKDKIAVDAVFLKRLWCILKIVIPSLWSKTFGHLIALSVLLYSRTVLRLNSGNSFMFYFLVMFLKVADIVGANAQYIVEKDLKYIILGVIQFALTGVPASIINSAMKYETTVLSLLFRKKLTEHVTQEYLKGTNFYKASNFGGESRIDNADQRVTQDISDFCESLSDLYVTLFKPLLDVILNTIKLSSVLGAKGPLLLFCYYGISGLFKRYVMPAFGRLTARASELEGDYRTAHQRLIVNSEEIAFYDGSLREKAIITRLFLAVYFHARQTHYLRYLMGIFDEFLVKYGASITGYAILALPVIEGGSISNKSAADLTNEFVRNRQLLINLAKGIAQLIVLSNKVTTLAGLTARVAELLEMVHILDEAGMKLFKVTEGNSSTDSSSEGSYDGLSRNARKDLMEFLDNWRKKSIERRNSRKSDRMQFRNKPPGATGGEYKYSDIIKFDNVTVVNPDGKVLLENITFQVKLKCNVIVTGPNGSGKSSLFRVLGELWPLHSGTISKPGNQEILFVPQKPYLVLGTLRDQIIYPHSKEEMMALGITDLDLEKLLHLVDPSRTILGQWDWDDVRDWLNALSGGQKQRVGMARLFYHCPKYGILDECTSAVSVEVEDKIYKTCKKLGITLFTVSHRASLRKYHDFEFHLNGSGGWTWSKIERQKTDETTDDDFDFGSDQDDE